MTTDVEEDLDVKSLSVVRVTYHARSFVRGTGALDSAKAGVGREKGWAASFRKKSVAGPSC
jgi:hypothetical protein